MSQIISMSQVAEIRRRQLAALLGASAERLEKQRLSVERALDAVDRIQRLCAILDDRLARRPGISGRIERELERRMARRVAEIAPLVEALLHRSNRRS